MGRHSNGKNNYALSGGVIAALIAVLALVGGLIFVLSQRGEDQAGRDAQEPTCVSGDLSLPIAASNEAVAQTLIDAYADTKPVVRDYCVKPQLVDAIGDAAVYVAPNTAVTHQALSQHQRTAATAEPESVYADVVGLAGDAVQEADVPVSEVRFPTDSPSSSAIAASILTATDDEAIAALTNQRITSAADLPASGGKWVATSKLSAPDGFEFRPLAASVVYAAIPLNSGETVDENQARAGQDFARSSSEAFEEAPDAPEQPVVSELVWAAALPQGGEALTQDASPGAGAAGAAAAGGVEDTLFLLDTSEGMAPYIEDAKEAVAQAAGLVAEQGKRVALWNYSSPLSPGVTQGYRRNVDLTPEAASVQDSVRRFLVGGQPQTREAVSAAMASFSGPGRVVLITSGTADAGDDAAFRDSILASQSGASLAVVHVGEAQKDATLESVASSRQNVAVGGQDLTAAVKAAAGVE